MGATHGASGAGERRSSARWWAVVLLVVGLLGSVLAACEGDNEAFDAVGNSIANANAGDSAEGDGGLRAARSSGGSEAGDDGVGLGQAPALPADRKLVVTGSAEVETDDVPRARAELIQFVQVQDGFVFAEEAIGLDRTDDLADDDDRRDRGSTPTRARVIMTIKVPPEAFAAVVDRLGELGRVRRQERSAQDVTEEYVDTETRLATAERATARIRDLIETATALDDIVSLEGELARREADIESLKGRLRVLDNRTSLSTLTVTIIEVDAEDLDDADDDREGFLGGLAEGWDAFVRFGSSTLFVLGAMLPFAAVLLPLLLLVVAIVRRRSPAVGPTAGSAGGSDVSPATDPAASDRPEGE